MHKPRSNARTGARILIDALQGHGLTHAFGVPGESYLAVLDALHDAAIDVLVCRNEGGAAMMAEAYGKLTGRPAACFAIAGPGSTNLLTGLYDAKVDRAPVLAISGQVPSKVLGRGAFQDLDLAGAFADGVGR